MALSLGRCSLEFRESVERLSRCHGLLGVFPNVQQKGFRSEVGVWELRVFGGCLWSVFGDVFRLIVFGDVFRVFGVVFAVVSGDVLGDDFVLRGIPGDAVQDVVQGGFRGRFRRG